MKIITTKKPWGSFTRFTHNELSTVKLLRVQKGEEFSLQYHMHREEFWRILEGNPEVTVGDKIVSAHPGEDFVIPPKTNHRISATLDDVLVLEISTGQFDENDIVRIEDKYHRT